ncbi:MAG: hypothetical protein M5U14_19525 [Acidimicrobiia bacterium]|nr:hypothetical protein [Acidimicrobiia bacterium]
MEDGLLGEGHGAIEAERVEEPARQDPLPGLVVKALEEAGREHEAAVAVGEAVPGAALDGDVAQAGDVALDALVAPPVVPEVVPRCRWCGRGGDGR